jgi:hypothetical protein
MTRVRDVSIMIRPLRGPGVRMTAVAAVLAGTGLVLSGAAAAGQQLTRPILEYTCRSPGWQPVPVQVAVSIPGTATAGQPIHLVAPALTVTLPRADRARLAKLNASEVSVTAQLRGEASGNDTSVADHWLLKTVTAPVPSHGNMVLQVPGAVQPVTERAAGNVTFTAAGLSLLLAPQITDGTTASPAPSTAASPAPSTAADPAPSTAASPAPIHLTCTLNPGQTATLARLPVVATAGPAAAAPHLAAGHFTTGLWESAPGGSFSGTTKHVTLKDDATGTVITCASSSMSGTAKAGQQVPPAGIGSIPSVTVQTCTGPGGKSFTIATSASASHPWLLNAQSFAPTLNVVTGTISGIMAIVSGPACSATVAGPSATAPGAVGATNSIDQFTLADSLSVGSGGGTLHAWNVSGCSSLFNGGDALTLTATYTVTPSLDMAPAYCPPFPVKTGFPFNKHFKFPKPPAGSTVVPPTQPGQSCAFIKGFTNVKKLNGAALVGPGFGNIQKARRIVEKIVPHDYTQIDSSGKLYYKPCPGSAPQCKAIAGLPPVHATLLSFGFLPITATLQITQVGTLNIVSVSHGVTLNVSRVQSLASIRVEKVLVNGVPLNVGSDCHSVKPFTLKLTGVPPYSLDSGGVLSGTIDVPPFTGCGVGENLDPIFNATVSGPGNLAQLTQGTLCSDWPVQGNFPTAGCPPNVPKPVH